MPNFSHPFLQKIFAYPKEKEALIYQNHSYTYDELCQQTQAQIKCLSNIPNGSSMGIIGDYDIDCVSMLLAGIEKKMILVPLSEQISNPEKLEIAQTDLLFQNNILTPYTHKAKHTMLQHLQDSSQSGLILFSSGSTGKPKAIVHNLDNLLNAYREKKYRSIKILLFLMFDHIGGLNTLFNTLAMGACGVGIENRKNVELLAQTIQNHQISLLPASPSLLNLMLLSEVNKHYNLSSLKVITYGTEQMPSSLLARLKDIFPKVKFHQTFGATEVGITQTKSFKNAIKLEDVAYKIIQGELYLKSDTCALGYLNVSDNVFDAQGYFATGDLVETIEKDGEEYIRIVGRIKEIINVGGEKVLPQEVEEVVFEMDGIKDCLAYGEANPITGQSVSLKVVLDEKILDPKDKIGLKKLIREFCKNRLENYKIPTKIIVTQNLNVSTRFKKMRR